LAVEGWKMEARVYREGVKEGRVSEEAKDVYKG